MKYRYNRHIQIALIALGLLPYFSLAQRNKKYSRSATHGLLTAGAPQKDYVKNPQTAIDVDSLVAPNNSLHTPKVPSPIAMTDQTTTVQPRNKHIVQHQPSPSVEQTKNDAEKTHNASAPSSQTDIETDSKDDTISFQFEDADLQALVTQIEDFFDITFIAPDALSPAPSGAKLVKGNKITFSTHSPLSRQQAWDLFVTFLYTAGFSIIPTADPKFYVINTIAIAQKSPTPTFIGTDIDKLPDNDQIIRYVYFISNSTVDVINNVVNMLKSKESLAQPLQETKAILLVDKAYNVKTLMQIVKEIDKVSMPQEMTVLKLRRVDAQEVKKLYDELTQSEDKNFARFFPARKQSTSLYFPENARLIAEPRTNALILLGPKDALRKIEEFIRTHVDVELDQPYSPIHTYQLKYADANTVAEILNQLTKFGRNTKAGESGGVRGVDKYLQAMSFTPEKETNKLIIRGDYEDYLQVKDIIEKLDEPQPQVAIEVLILSVQLKDTKELGTQLRTKDPGTDGLLGKNVKFQTSGLFVNGTQKGILENTQGSGVTRLLTDMIKLLSGGDSAGSTILSLGSDKFGVWGIFKVLETISNTQVISNPFVTTTNKTKATVQVGETRRVTSGVVIAGTNREESQEDSDANLKLDITPLINSDGKIALDIEIQINQFGANVTIGEITAPIKQVRELKTNAIVANKEVLALGGLIRTQDTDVTTKVPVLGDIPLIGWFFKNKQKSLQKDNLLILISSQIIQPERQEETLQITKSRLKKYDETLQQMQVPSEQMDPVYRTFFKPRQSNSEQVFEQYAEKQIGYTYGQLADTATKNRGRRKKKKKSNSQKELQLASQQAQHPPETFNKNSLMNYFFNDKARGL